jgi:hypothetical protein
MQIKNARSALISNFEVLQLLEESQEAQKKAQRLDPLIEYPEQLRTVQFEVYFEIHFYIIQSLISLI